MADDKFLDIIEKAEKEAEKMVQDARDQATEMKSEAVQKAEDIVAEARKRASQERQEEMSAAELKYREVLDRVKNDGAKVGQDISEAKVIDAAKAVAERIKSKLEQ